MYPELFILWIGQNGMFMVGDHWYMWPKNDPQAKDSVWVADTVAELFEIFSNDKKD